MCKVRLFCQALLQLQFQKEMIIFFQSLLLQRLLLFSSAFKLWNTLPCILKTFVSIFVFDKSAVHFRNHSLLLIIIHQSGGEWWWTFSEPQHWDEWLFKRIVQRSGSARVFGYSVFRGVLNRVYGILQLKYGYSVYHFLWISGIKYSKLRLFLGIFGGIWGILGYFVDFFSGILVFHYPPWPTLKDTNKQTNKIIIFVDISENS